MVDLTGPRSTVASLFDATCTITRDPQGTTDDVFDENTGQLTPPTGDTSTVYSGPTMIRPGGYAAQLRSEGDQIIESDTYRARLPVDAPLVAPGDIYTVDSCTSDPELVDQTFTVLAVTGGSLSVSRILTLQRRSRGPRL